MIPKIFGTETQETIAQWALSAFGDVKKTRSILTRAGCELAELVHAVECGAPKEKIAAEIADVIIVLCRYPIDIVDAVQQGLGWSADDTAESLLGFVDERLYAAKGADRTAIIDVLEGLGLYAMMAGIDLPAAIDAKMKINRGRKWVSKGAGHGQHVPEASGDEKKRASIIRIVEEAIAAVHGDRAAVLIDGEAIGRKVADQIATSHEREVLRLATEYKVACAAIAGARINVDDTPGPSLARDQAVTAYHAAITRAGNARRALLAYVSGDTPEVTP